MKNRLNTLVKKNKSSIIVVILIALLIYLFIPDPETIKESFALIKDAELVWVIIAIVLFFLTIPLNTMQLRVVSVVKVKFWLAFKVQMAFQFIGKLLPTSISAFIVNSFYLHQVGHTASKTASVIAIKAVSSSIAFIILCIISIILGLNNLKELNLSSEINTSDLNLASIILIFVVAGVSIFWVLLKIQKTRELLEKTIGNFWGQFKTYKDRPWDVVKAISYSLILTTFQALTLLSCSFALGLEINFTQVFLIFTLGNTAAMLVPTPGGVGAAEAGLYAGFTFLGFPAAESLAVVTLYRVITFWIPIIPGLIFFISLKKDLFANFSISIDMFKKQENVKMKTA